MNRRVLEPVEARLMFTAGALLLAAAILFWFFPNVLIYPIIVVSVWSALALLYRGAKLHRQGRRETGGLQGQAPTRQPGEAPRDVEVKRD